MTDHSETGRSVFGDGPLGTRGSYYMADQTNLHTGTLLHGWMT